MSSTLLALDGSVSPYLPPNSITETGPSEDFAGYSPAELARLLRGRLALLHRVSPARIALFPDDAFRLRRIVRTASDRPVVWYAPVVDPWRGLAELGESIQIERGPQFQIDREQIEATPPGATALVMTPNDPTGNAIGLGTAANLARRAGLLVLDERSAEMQRRSMIPLVEEFDSIVLVRSFRDWAGLGPEAPAYAIGSSSIVEQIDMSGLRSTEGLKVALVAVSNAAHLDAIAHRVRLERMRLFRMLRKLNFLAPLPSDAGYVLAQITRGERDEIADALRARGIVAYSPNAPRLAQTLRFTALSPVATRRLQHALVEISHTVSA